MKKRFVKTHFFHFDYALLILALLLFGIGLVFLYSATKSTQSIRNMLVQSIAGILGISLMFLVSFLDYRTYLSYQKHIYIGSVLLLLFVLFFGSGKEETGANSWIRFGPIGIQPSELVKILFVLSFSFRIADAKEAGKLNSIKEILTLFACFLVLAGLVVLQNDTGTALVFAFMFATMLFVAGISYKYILASLLASFIVLPGAWFLMAPYQRERILVFLRPERDALGAGYQVMQSKIAIGSGELFGRGYLNGPQNQLAYLPEKDTDFIFATIGEEFGFFGAVFVVILLFLLILRCFFVSRKTDDMAGSLICVGLGAMFLFHTIENVCMCIGLLPVTGIPLPFLSYGGSSVVTNFIAVGILQNIYRGTKEFRFKNYDG